MSPMAKALDRLSILSSDRIVVNSRWIADIVGKIYGTFPVVCPPGFDDEKLFPVKQKGEVTVQGLKIPKPFILSTTRHYAQKGLSDLIRIFSLVRNESNAKLVITGNFTNYTRALRSLCAELGLENEVAFTGRVTEGELVKLYQNADVYAFTSPEEDFGLGPIEAMSCGTPPVVWDHAGPRETVIDETTGLRARPNDLHNFAAKLKLLLTDTKLNAELSNNAVRHAKHNYSWSNHVKMLESILLDAAGLDKGNR